jgi:D-3-phosphoglycerate dehydrogenase
VFGGNILRIVEIDGFKVEMTPAGAVMIVYNDDRPGVVGAVGCVCGEYGININTMGVGQKPGENKALLAVSLDKCPDADMVKAVKKLDFVNQAHICKLND